MNNSDKVKTLKEAVSHFIHDNCHISFGGFTVNRQPMACAYEMIRQGKKNLHVYIHSGGQALDILIGAGCIKAVEIAYGANGRFAPTCVRFRKAVERGELLVEDYSNYQMTLRFQAGAMGVPFLPVKSGMGTDIVKKWGFSAEMRRKEPGLPNQKLLVQNNPFAGDDREPQADTQGTVRINGLTFADVEQARAAKHVIITCEELVDPGVLRTEPDRNQIPFFAVDAVVHVPHGAHPCACYGCYDYDAQHLNLYRKMALDDETFAAYLDEFVLAVNSHEEYLDKIGSEVLECIRAVPPFGYAPGLKRG